jgi:hypothetical protein
MKKIILHIGTGKTGTSTIQNSLYLNKDILKEKFGICYCPIGLTCYDHFGEIIQAHYDFSQWVIHENTEKINQVVEFINHCEADTIIFSCETMYHHFAQRQIQYLRKIFDQYSVTIVCYVRRQDLFLESGYKQQVKVGDFTIRLQDFLKRHTDKKFLDTVHGNYYRMLNVWAETFSRESIILRIFDKACFHENNLLSDFYASLGISEPDVLKNHTTPVNRAFPSDLIEVIRMYNLYGICPKETHDCFVNYLRSFSFYTNPPMLTYRNREDVLHNYEEVNKKLFEEYGVKKTWARLQRSERDTAAEGVDVNKEKILCSIIYKGWLDQKTDTIVLRNNRLSDLKLFIMSSLKAVIRGKLSLLKSIIRLNNLNIFSPTFYLEDNLDIVQAGVCPFEHYITFGWKEYRKPGPNLNHKLLVDIYNQFSNEKHMV